MSRQGISNADFNKHLMKLNTSSRMLKHHQSRQMRNTQSDVIHVTIDEDSLHQLTTLPEPEDLIPGVPMTQHSIMPAILQGETRQDNLSTVQLVEAPESRDVEAVSSKDQATPVAGLVPKLDAAHSAQTGLMLAGSGTSLGSPFVASQEKSPVHQSGFISIIEMNKASETGSSIQLDKSPSIVLLSHKASDLVTENKARPFD